MTAVREGGEVKVLLVIELKVVVLLKDVKNPKLARLSLSRMSCYSCPC